MAFVSPKDRVMETSISNSQTVFALSGAIDASFNRFSASMAVGDTTVGAVVEPGVAFKTGVLTYSATNQVTVDSTGFESKGTFSSGGTKEVFMGLPAAAAVNLGKPNVFSDTTEATGANTTAAMLIAGGVEIFKKLFVGGAVKVTNTTEATGALSVASAIFAGGVEIAKKIFVGGAARFMSTTASTSPTTGAVVVDGGLGVSGNIVSGGAIKHVGALGTLTSSVNGQARVTVPNGNVLPFYTGPYAILFVSEQLTYGSTAIFIVSNGASIIAGQSGNPIFVAGTAPGAGQVSVGYSGSSVVLINNTGNALGIKLGIHEM